MGVESGEDGRGEVSPAVDKSAGDIPARNYDILVSLPWHIWKFCSLHHFQNKLAEIRGETKFWG